jgi:hypothetical protein
MFSVPQPSQRGQESAVGAANRLRDRRSVIRLSARARISCLLHNIHSVSEAHSSWGQGPCSETEEARREDTQDEVKNEWSYKSVPPSGREQRRLYLLCLSFR